MNYNEAIEHKSQKKLIHPRLLNLGISLLSFIKKNSKKKKKLTENDIMNTNDY